MSAENESELKKIRCGYNCAYAIPTMATATKPSFNHCVEDENKTCQMDEVCDKHKFYCERFPERC